MPDEITINEDYESKYGFKDDTSNYEFIANNGLSHDIVRKISELKCEPEWMKEFRLRSLDIFFKKNMPEWGGNLSKIDFDSITYFMRASKTGHKWEDVPEKIRKTFDRLGIPEAERNFLGGVGAQYESEVVYHSLKKDLSDKGIIFTDMDTAMKEHPDLVKKYFGTVVPAGDNKFAALNSAVWSGGSFVYIPKGVKVEFPLQAYFRINAKNLGQFERTLIIVDEEAQVHYVEGCTAPIYSTDSLHAAVVEVIALKGSKVRYTTIQNWSNNIYNLVTKRAFAYEGATVEWVDGNLGSKLTMKYPSVYLKGKNSKAEVLSIAFAGKNQHQDAGAKVVHLASGTTSRITSKSISKDGGRASYRGLVKVAKGALDVKANIVCDALLMDKDSRSDTYPVIQVDQEGTTLAHEAKIGKIGEEQIFYLMSRGLTEHEAATMIVLGFIQPFTKELPMEYAVELNRLIQLEMEGSIG